MVRRLLVCCAAAGLLSGCPGELTNPERFLSPDGGTACDVEDGIFKPECGAAGCHDPVTQSQGLDLVSPGVRARLATANATCASAAGQPMASWMLAKVKPSPGCGSAMPVGGPELDAAALDCLTRYLANLDGGT